MAGGTGGDLQNNGITCKPRLRKELLPKSLFFYSKGNFKHTKISFIQSQALEICSMQSSWSIVHISTCHIFSLRGDQSYGLMVIVDPSAFVRPLPPVQ